MSYFLLFLCGACGATIKDILKDGCLTIPYVRGKKLYLGGFASALIGGAVGVAVDHSFLIAFFSGYVGFSVVENMFLGKASVPELEVKPTTND